MIFDRLNNQSIDYFLYQWMWKALDWLYPPSCGGCGKRYERWCSACQNKSQKPLNITHTRGGRNHSLNRISVAHPTSQSPNPYVTSWGTFSGPLREAIHKLKYKRDMGLGEALSKHLISLLQKYNWPIDIILAVPLSSERLKTRGYNQSALLALPVSLYCKIPFKSKAIWRTRDTMSQVGLSPSERRLNVAGAFQADPDVLNNKTVLIIDDVTTTGATINACAKALSDAGAEFVYGLTLASAVSNPDFVHHLPKLISMSE